MLKQRVFTLFALAMFILGVIGKVHAQTQASAAQCPLTLQQYDHRLQFLQQQIDQQNQIQQKVERNLREWNKSLKAMEGAHNAATVCAIVSAAALTAVGASIGWTTLIRGNSIVAFGGRMVMATRASATAMMAGEVIEVTKGMIGMTYFFLARTAVMLPADAYMIYRDLFGNHTDFGQAIDAQTIERIAQTSQLYPDRAMSFINDPDWHGSSDELNNPMFMKAINEVGDWQQRQLDEIGDSWGIFEYFTKDYLEQSAVNAQAYQIAADIGRFQLFYWHGLKSMLRAQKDRCLLGRELASINRATTTDLSCH